MSFEHTVLEQRLRVWRRWAKYCATEGKKTYGPTLDTVRAFLERHKAGDQRLARENYSELALKPNAQIGSKRGSKWLKLPDLAEPHKAPTQPDFAESPQEQDAREFFAVPPWPSWCHWADERA